MDACAMNCHHRFYTLEDFFRSVQRNGFHSVELWTGPMHFFMDAHGYDDTNRLYELSKKYNVKIIGICPEQTNPKPHNMAESSNEGQKRVYAYFKNAIDVAAMLHANQVVVTSGWAYYREDLQEAKKRSAKMLHALCDYAKTKNIPLAIEALQPKESLLAHTIEDLQEFLSLVQHDQLKICLDLGAMAAAQDTITAYFQTFGKKIIHCHFVDGNPTGHKAWGDGTRNMKQDLLDLKQHEYEGYCSFEIVHPSYFAAPFEADAKSKALFDYYKKEIS